MDYVIPLKFRPIIRVSGERFKLSPKERGKLLTAKLKHRRSLQKAYGTHWKRHLNPPEKTIGKSIHVSF